MQLDVRRQRLRYLCPPGIKHERSNWPLASPKQPTGTGALPSRICVFASPLPAGSSREMGQDGDIAASGEQPFEDDSHRLVDLLYRDRAGALQRRIRAQVGSPEEASDLVQEAFSRLLGARAGASLRNPGAFLNRIVRNLLIDRSRRNAVRPPLVPLESETAVAVPADQGDALELAQMHQRYREIVDDLPPRTREVFLLHRVDELGYREIADRLDISIRTVEWHIAQAIYRIGRELDEE
jgi:RNA polymerase sigma factor (sigma-70 family)